MMEPFQRCLCPSVLSADFSRLAEEIERVREHTGLVHLDVMDGHFVPNITFGPPVVKSIRKATDLPLDCHLMIENPDRYVPEFAKAGADYLSVHVEACPHLHRTIQLIRSEGMIPGVALNPATPLTALDLILGDVDFVLVMSVNPGFGGQSFIPVALDKIESLAQRIRSENLDVAIQVDGGVSLKTVTSLVTAGAEWFVAGSAVFGAEDPAAAAAALLEKIHG